MSVVEAMAPAGSSKQHAKSATSRVGDDVQRAKENISEAGASARDDIAADLRRLSADVTSLKDTVARACQDRDGGGRRSGDRHRRGHRVGRKPSAVCQ